jgi:hypothetical protein
MAIDFPDSPTPGQEFQGYYWDDSKQAWRSQSTNRGSVITSATTPTGATAGDLWFNTVDGTMYVYYDDGITTQWVEIQANVDNYKTPSQNYIINGAFDIWQRGTSFSVTSSHLYTADRWQAYRQGLTLSVSRQVSGLTSFQHCIRYQRPSGDTNTQSATLTYNLETIDSIPLAGKTVTLSFYARSGENFNPGPNNLVTQIFTGTGTNQNVNVTGFTNAVVAVSRGLTISSSWSRYSVTATLGSSITQVGIPFTVPFSGTAGANDWLEITGVQLEEGTIATPFRRNQPNIQAELAACQRYYEKSYSTATSPGTVTEDGVHRHSGSGNGSGRHYVPIRFKVEKRTNGYTVNTYNPTAAGAAWITQNSAQAGLARTPLVENKSTSGMVLNVEDGGYAWAVGNTRGHWAVSDEL